MYYLRIVHQCIISKNQLRTKGGGGMMKNTRIERRDKDKRTNIWKLQIKSVSLQ